MTIALCPYCGGPIVRLGEGAEVGSEIYGPPVCSWCGMGFGPGLYDFGGPASAPAEAPAQNKA